MIVDESQHEKLAVKEALLFSCCEILGEGNGQHVCMMKSTGSSVCQQHDRCKKRDAMVHTARVLVKISGESRCAFHNRFHWMAA